ncbi:MAG: DUF2905 domain-containing protein [Cytophagaceae bacterium]
MEQFNGIAKILLITGACIMGLGLLLLLAGKIPFLGKLPGDISFRGRNWTIHFPIITSIILSILLSLVFYLFRRFF